MVKVSRVNQLRLEIVVVNEFMLNLLGVKLIVVIVNRMVMCLMRRY